MIKLPEEKIAELCRQEALKDCEFKIMAPRWLEFDKWDVLKNADFDSIEYDGENYNHVIAYFDTEVKTQRQTHAATHWEPASYETKYLETHVCIWWDLDASSIPEVGIEVLDR